MDFVWAYHSRLEQQVRDAGPHSIMRTIQKASLPWALGTLPAAALLFLTAAPFGLVVALGALPLVGLLFVQFTMLSEFARMRRERR
jgi:hypothetical protein